MSMHLILLASLFIGLDFRSSSWSSTTEFSQAGEQQVHVTGHWSDLFPGEQQVHVTGRWFDLFPDELGFLLFGLALMALARSSTGFLSLSLCALAAIEAVLAVRVFRSHFFSFTVDHQAAHGVEEIQRAGSSSQQLVLVTSFWLVALVCKNLEISLGERLWRRLAFSCTVIVLTAWVYAALQARAQPWFPSQGAVTLFLVVVIVCALALLSFFLRACLATRSEALSKSIALGSPPSSPETLAQGL